MFAYVDSVGKPYLDANLYTYTANNPVNLIDPQGLLIAPWHFWITYAAARNSGKGVSDSLKLAWDVARQDLNSLDKDAKAPNIHSMAGRIETDPGEYRPQTRDEALSEVLDIIQKADPLSSALHATQDFPGHNLESMENFGLNWSTVKHALRDIFDIFWVFKAYQETINLLNAKQPCK